MKKWLATVLALCLMLTVLIGSVAMAEQEPVTLRMSW